MSNLTPEEEIVLKELAENLLATNRVVRNLKAGLIWLSSTIGAGWVVWEFYLKHRGG